MFYPIFLDFADKEVLVIGGGKVGTKRALALYESGANVTIVSKTVSNELADSDIKLIVGGFREKKVDLKRFFMVVLATGDKDLNEEIAKDASRNNILVNRADKRKEGDILFPMVCEVEGHTLAFTTLGENPKLLKQIKEKIEDAFSKD